MSGRESDVEERIRTLRREYRSEFVLDENSVKASPFDQFSEWFDMALRAGLDEPNAMALATAGADGKPSVRMVLLKQVSPAGFCFYSNYRSRKGGEISENPQVSLLFYWAALERQIRIEGKAERLAREESEQYFKTRPRGAQLGASISAQSQVISGRELLVSSRDALDQRFQDAEIPCPEDWGGYRVVPSFFEFWQGREDRLHDRITYRLQHGTWEKERLSP